MTIMGVHIMGCTEIIVRPANQMSRAVLRHIIFVADSDVRTGIIIKPHGVIVFVLWIPILTDRHRVGIVIHGSTTGDRRRRVLSGPAGLAILLLLKTRRLLLRLLSACLGRSRRLLRSLLRLLTIQVLSLVVPSGGARSSGSDRWITRVHDDR